MERKSLAFKIILSISIFITLIIFASFYSIYMVNTIQGYANDTGTNWLPSMRANSNMNLQLANMSRRIMVIVADGLANKNDELTKNLDDIKKFRDSLDKEIKNYAQLLYPGEQPIYDDIAAAWAEYDKLATEEIEFVKQGKSLEALIQYREKGRPAVFKLATAIGKDVKFNEDGGEESTKKGNTLTFKTSLTMSVIITISIIVGLIVLKIIFDLTKSIKHGIENLKAQGESTMEISKLLMTSSQSLSESVTEQAASVHETTAAINEITSMVNKTSENAQESTKVAKNASNKAEESQKTMQKLVTSMETIQESNNQLQNIAEIINQIHAKTSVINDIVSKTELLSLNASIESARAGEYGKGFAVVAEEVGNLAKVSGKAAHEIQELITKSQEEVLKILNITKERVSEGKKVTAEAQGSFVQISEDIINMVSVIEQISAATKEQDIGVRQITTAMSEIDRATQNNQASVNSTAQSANKLVEQGEKLNETTVEIEHLIMGSQNKNSA